MSRILRRPGLFCALWGCWLLLAGSLSVAHLLLGALLAWALQRWCEPGRGANGLALRPLPLLRLTLRVAADIVACNLVVARQVLGSPARLRPALLELPLRLREPALIQALAAIVSLTPGTLSVDLLDDDETPSPPGPSTPRLQVHALHAPDPAVVIASIARYEALLLELQA